MQVGSTGICGRKGTDVQDCDCIPARILHFWVHFQTHSYSCNREIVGAGVGKMLNILHAGFGCHMLNWDIS
jgi:hypothetical protein